MNPITSQDEYLKHFKGLTLREDTKRAVALKYAHEIRKFEIDLYWKRATYFWTAIGVAFAAYFVSRSNLANNPDSGLLLSCIGLVFSLAWYFVNRGSKYWQDTWEQHVDLLENEISGPLYGV